MPKKSIDKDFYPKAEELMLSGMGPFQIVEELSKEYLDRKRIGDTLDSLIHPKERDKHLKQKKTLCVLAIIMFVANIIVMSFLSTNITDADLWPYVAILFFLVASFPLFVFLEYLPSKRNFKVNYSSYIWFPIMFILQNLIYMSPSNEQSMLFTVSNIVIWLPIVVLNAIWLIKSKKD